MSEKGDETEPQTKPVRFMLLIAGLILLLILIMQPLEVLHFGEQIVMLFPNGPIAIEQRDMLFVIQIIMFFVILPVYVLTFIFSWRYRADNKNATYDPDLIDNYYAEVVWWGLPLVLTIVVSIYTWHKTHELDPYKPLASAKKPMTIQVVALQWKWLFLYPEEKIATVNFVQFPKETPVEFLITADAPMNSFWIPALGGQIYAMPGMRTKLNLIADKDGDSRGASANISGEGFSGMHFIARSSSEEEYKKWVASAKQSTAKLDEKIYKELAEPSMNNPVALYQLQDDGLFEQIIMKYMAPQAPAKEEA